MLKFIFMEFLKEFKDNNAYIVGGAIRNYILKKEIKDLDIVIETQSGNFLSIIKKLSKKSNIFPLDLERKIYRINAGKLTIDISHTSDIISDILKRDFTINSLFVDINKVKIKTDKNSFILKLKSDDIKDITGGVKDIKKGIIRVISENSIKDDPLRILRAYRFWATLEFKIENKTFKIIKDSKVLLMKSSPERIREELIKIFQTDLSAWIISNMAKSGVLFVIFPQLKLQLKCAEVYYGKGGVLKHTINVLRRMDILLSNPQKYINLPSEIIEEVKNDISTIKMAGLLHDIAKPHKANVIGDRLRFFGHEEYGGVIAERILKNLRYSNNEIRYIRALISNHLRIGNLAYNNIITQKAIMRIFYELKEFTSGLLILSWADHSSYISEKKLEKSFKIIKEKPFFIKTKLPKTGIKKTIRFLQVVNMISKNYSNYTSAYNLKPVIDGNIIMKTLNIPPSKEVGLIIKRIINLQIEGKIKTKEEAIKYIKTLKMRSER